MNLQLLARRIQVCTDNAVKASEILNNQLKEALQKTELMTEELRKMNVKMKMRVVK